MNTNRLHLGDNLELLETLAKDQGNADQKFSLIYIDPPFYTKTNRKAVIDRDGSKVEELAYEDSWESMDDYLDFLRCRLVLMREILSDRGLIFVHGDWHSIHYIKVMMDQVFGMDRFVNEIIWQYKSGGSTKKHFARKHDNILVYSKSSKYDFYPQQEKSYNRGLKPYRFKGVQEFQDDVGWYTLVNMRDVWNIDMVGRTSGERTGYATQKPEKLMERIILSASKQGDLVGDFFCGSGSFGVVAAKLGRNFIMSDSSRLAIETVEARLDKEKVAYQRI